MGKTLQTVGIWKPVLDYEGFYEVSDTGDVRSLKGANILILKPIISTKGYYVVSLYKNGKAKIKTIHRLVYEAFNGKTDLQIDHKTENNKLNNSLNNLQAVTSRYNTVKYHLSKQKSSKYIGVYQLNNKKWGARITINGESIFLGSFNEEYNAAESYFNALNKFKNNDK